MENNENTTVKPNENPDEDFIPDLENITSQVTPEVTPEMTPEVPFNIEQREPNDPLIEYYYSDGVRFRYNNLARIAEEEPSVNTAETIQIEESTDVVVAELPIAEDAIDVIDIIRSLPEYDDYECGYNECQMFTAGIEVGAIILFLILVLAFIKEMSNILWN